MDEMDRFKGTYFAECFELLGDMEVRLMALDEGNADPEDLNAIFRVVHSVKGGAGAFGFERIGAFSHILEGLLDAMREGQIAPSRQAIDLLIKATDVLTDLVRAAQSGEELAADYGADTAAALQVLAGAEQEKPPPPATEQDAQPQSPAPSAPAGDGEGAAEHQFFHIRFAPFPGMLQKANEPLLLMRELKSLGKTVAVPDLSRLPLLDELDAEEAYLSWNIDVDCPAGLDAVREVFEFVEDDCDLKIDVVAGVSLEQRSPDTASPDSRRTAATERAAPDKGAARAGVPAPAVVSTIRVDLGRVDRLVNMVGELVITQTMLAQQASRLPPDHYLALTEGIEALSQHSRELQESVMAIRAQPVKSVFARMPRLVRELSAQVGKEVRLVTAGEDTEVDKTVIEQIGDPLTHMIRNSVDHGIEPPDVRASRGKSKQGTIRLSAEHRSGRIVIEVADDGGGIDRERVLAKAVDKGLVAADAALSDEEIDNLIFMPGFSTAETVSSISGRGVGMDVVKRNIQGMGGRVYVHSAPGHGTRLSLSLPLTLAVLDGMIVAVAQENYVLPLTNIVESLRPPAHQVHSVVDGGDVLALRGDYVRLVYLHRLFGIEGAVTDPAQGLVVVVETEAGDRVGLVVDELLGQQQVVIKSLETNYRPIQGVAGATILGDGKVALILDVAGLRAMASFTTGAMKAGTDVPAESQECQR